MEQPGQPRPPRGGGPGGSGKPPRQPKSQPYPSGTAPPQVRATDFPLR